MCANILVLSSIGLSGRRKFFPFLRLFPLDEGPNTAESLSIAALKPLGGAEFAEILRRSRSVRMQPGSEECSMAASQSTILAAAKSFSHDEACRLAAKATVRGGHMIVIDLSDCGDASTAAFARVVLLRRELLEAGRDLCLAGLHGQPARLFEVHRLDSVLPQLAELPKPAEMPKQIPAPRQPRPRRAALATAC
jgi:anti-anti-sigma regulatory factor